jgi:hypothetical protein
MHGDLTRAREAFAQHLRLCLEHDWPTWAAHSLGWLAAIAARDDSPERAATLLGAARSLGDLGDSRVREALERDFYAPARARCDPQRWRAAESLGETMSLEDAVTYALA